MSLIEGKSGEWETVIGLEVHAQAVADAKLFAGAATAFGAEPGGLIMASIAASNSSRSTLSTPRASSWAMKSANRPVFKAFISDRRSDIKPFQLKTLLSLGSPL